MSEFPANICKEVSPSSSSEELKTFVSRVRIYKKHRKMSDKDALASIVLFFNYEIAEWFDNNLNKFKNSFDIFLKKFSETWIQNESRSSLEQRFNQFRFNLYNNIGDQLRQFWKLTKLVFSEKISEEEIVTLFRIHVIKNMKLRVHVENAENQGKLMQLLGEYAQQHPTFRSINTSRYYKPKSSKKFFSVKREKKSISHLLNP